MKLAATLVFALCTAGASAQTVYRCGATYTDTPCAEGRVVAVADPRSGAEQHAADNVVQRDRMLAREMVAERLLRERELRANGSGLSNVGPAAEIKPKVLLKKVKAKRHPPAAPDTYRGAVPSFQ
jgi:hypothetical protein